MFEEVLHEIPAAGLAEDVVKAWEDVRQVREIVTKRLEEKREQKEIGSSLAAELDIYAAEPVLGSLKRLGEDLRFVLITSRASVHPAKGGVPLEVQVAASKHPKCDRCWHYRADVNGEGLCGRCVSNLEHA